MGEGAGALERLQEGIDAVLAVAPSIGGDEDDLIAFLRPLRAQLNRGELAFAVVSGRLSERYRDSESFDPLSPTELLRHECQMASGAAAAAVNIGEQLGGLGLSRAALEAGRIGISHLNLIAYTAEFIGERFEEAPLLARAERSSVTAFARICRQLRYQARPALAEQEERELHEARFLELSTRDEDGAVWLRGMLDKEGGAYVRTAIEALSRPLPDDDRRAGQRRADALVEIAKAGLDEGRPPRCGTVRPHLQVTATLESLLGLPGAPPAELAGSGPVSHEMLSRLAADAGVRRVLLDESSLVIDVGRERRTFSGAARVALEHRDGGCVWPGCTRAARFCQSDHQLEWWRGGETRVGNGRLLCRHHHRLRGDGWQLTRTDDAGWIATPPVWSLADLPAG